jgi:hypothetical protein
MSEFIDLTRRRGDSFWLALSGMAGEIDRPSYQRIKIPPAAHTGGVELQVRIGDDWGAVMGWEVWDGPRGGRCVGAASLRPPYAQPGDTMVLTIDMRPKATPAPEPRRPPTTGERLWQLAKTLAVIGWLTFFIIAWEHWVAGLIPSLGYVACGLLALFGVFGVGAAMVAYLGDDG